MPRFSPKQFLEREGDGKSITGYKAGEHVFKQGMPASHVFYLQIGKAKESVTSDRGKDAVLGMLEPGFFFGTSALDGTGVRESTVTAITNCLVTEITTSLMQMMLRREQEFSQAFMSHLLQTNSRIVAEKIDLLLSSSEKRLAQKLLVLAHFGETPIAQIIGPEIKQEMLAEMVGTTRGRVNYFLNRFRNLGLIRYSGEGIIVLPALLTAVMQAPREEPPQP